MSYNTIPTFFLIVSLLYATTTPLAHATFATSLTVTGGRLSCTPTGNFVAGSVGVPGATVTLRCPVFITPTVVSTTVTDPAGNYAFVNVPLSPFTVSSLCVATVQLPLNGTVPVAACPLLATAAPRTLIAGVRITNNGILTGGIATGVAGPFVSSPAA